MLLAQFPSSQSFAASCLLFALFFVLASFVFISLQPLFAEYRGWGIPNASTGCRGGVGIPIRPLDSRRESGHPEQRSRKAQIWAYASNLRINNWLVDILPDAGMPQAVEVVGKTAQQGFGQLH